MQRKAGRPAKDNYFPLGNNSEYATSSDDLAERVGESKNQIFRYIRLTELIPELLQMEDANLQREKILPSEKAFAYKIKLEVMKRQGQRTDLTSRPVVGKSERAGVLGEAAGDSGRQVQRYIRITELIPDLLQKEDANPQREKILPSEKAFAYKMRLEAMKRKAGRPSKENSVPVGHHSLEGKSRELLAANSPDSNTQIQRYIRLTHIVPDLLQMVDANLLGEKILLSKKAFVYKMRSEAMQRKAGRPSKDNSVPMAQNYEGKRSREILAEQTGESHEQIRKFIRLTELIPDPLQMVDANLQKEKLLPSEKAFAYKIKLEAMKRQGNRNDLTCPPLVEKLKGKDALTATRIGAEAGDGHEQVRRYIRLTELIPDLLQTVDANLQREKILPSEKAFAYKMRLEAMKRKAGRPGKENASPVATNFPKGRSDVELAQQVGESKDQVRRYIRLTELVVGGRIGGAAGFGALTRYRTYREGSGGIASPQCPPRAGARWLLSYKSVSCPMLLLPEFHSLFA